MQELLDEHAPAAPAYAGNDPVGNIDPTGRTCQNGLTPGWTEKGMWFEAAFRCNSAKKRVFNIEVNPLSCIIIQRVKTKLPAYKDVLKAPASGCTQHEKFYSASTTITRYSCCKANNYPYESTHSVRINGENNSWALLTASHCYKGEPGATTSMVYVRTTLQWQTWNSTTKKYGKVYKKAVPASPRWHYACPLES